jgi:transposase
VRHAWTSAGEIREKARRVNCSHIPRESAMNLRRTLSKLTNLSRRGPRWRAVCARLPKWSHGGQGKWLLFGGCPARGDATMIECSLRMHGDGKRRQSLQRCRRATANQFPRSDATEPLGSGAGTPANRCRQPGAGRGAVLPPVGSGVIRQPKRCARSLPRHRAAGPRESSRMPRLC